MNTHLSDEQLDVLLDNPEKTDPHLANCAQCRGELAALRASFTDLRTSLTGLAEAPPPRCAPARMRPRAWVLAAASLVLGAVLVPALHHRQPVAAPVVQAAAPVNNQEDEALLEGINQDLSTPVAPSLRPLSVESPTRQ